MKQLILKFIFIPLPILSFGQSVSILTDNPTWQDSIKIQYSAFFGSYPCTELYRSIDIEAHKTVIKACYYEGFLSMPCLTVDTIKIKIPDYTTGNYNFILEMGVTHSNPPDQICAWTYLGPKGDTILFSDTATVFISDPSAIGENRDNGELTFTIRPNPANNMIRIDYPFDRSGSTIEHATKIVITDIFGRPAVETSITKGVELDISHLHPGIYTVTAIWPDGALGRKRLVVQR